MSMNSRTNSASHSPSGMRSGRVFSRRASCWTLPMIVLTRSALARMISVMRRLASVSRGSSASSCAAWLIAPMGFLISCAIEADSRPSAARRVWWMRSSSAVRSSRNTSTGGGCDVPSGAKCGRTSRRPSTASRLPPAVSVTGTLWRHIVSRYRSRGDTSPSSASAVASPPRIWRADSLISRIRSCSSTTTRLSRSRSTMYCDSSARFARSRSRWRTSSSLSRSRRAIGPTAVAAIRMTAPSRPAWISSEGSARSDSQRASCWPSTQSAAIAAIVAAAREGSSRLTAATGRISSSPAPLAAPALASSSAVTATTSIATWMKACASSEGQRRFSSPMQTTPPANQPASV